MKSLPALCWTVYEVHIPCHIFAHWVQTIQEYSIQMWRIFHSFLSCPWLLLQDNGQSYESVSPCISGHLTCKQSDWSGEMAPSLSIVIIFLSIVFKKFSEVVCHAIAVHFLVGHRYHAKSSVSVAMILLLLSAERDIFFHKQNFQRAQVHHFVLKWFWKG